MRTSTEIMAEMRKTAGPNTWNLFVELEQEYMVAKEREAKDTEAYMVKLDGKRNWLRKLVSA